MITLRPRFLVCLWFLIFVVVQSGCQKIDSRAKQATIQPPKGARDHDKDHPDKGPHGGVLAEWGDEQYHVEVTFDHKGKQAVIYLLDSTAKNAPKVEPNKVTKVMLTITNTQPPISLQLQHDAGKSSDQELAFVGTHDGLSKEMDFTGTVAGTVDKENFEGEFKKEGKK